ncbi:MAG: PqqD family protein [Candidatus Omnitrophica bacterium]|nr:PqqD family protein [Candidatus Omnitrophota bacterium]
MKKGKKLGFVKDKSEMNYLEKIYQKDPNIVSRRIADEVILVPIRQNVGDLESIYTLNEVAARTWELLDGKRNVKEVRDIIVEEFEVTLQQTEKDIKELLKRLEKIKAIK